MSRERRELQIPVAAYLADHRLPAERASRRSVLPATEALQALAACCQAARPACSIETCTEAKFMRFIPTPAPPGALELQVEMDWEPELCQARLMSRRAAGRSGLSRSIVHVQACFGAEPSDEPLDDLEVCGLPGPGLRLSATRLYEELVPFGPAFQNLGGEVFLSPAGAWASIAAPAAPAPSEPLGSPFALDAAFHLACAWTQHRHGVLTFPIAFAERRVLRPVAPAQLCFCRLRPAGRSRRAFLFDLALLDQAGRTLEWVRALEMGDIFEGRAPAPAWIRKERDLGDRLEAFFRACEVEGRCWPLEAMAPYAAAQALSAEERTRWPSMGEARRLSYLGARLSLKALARARGARGRAAGLQTVAEDGRRPACPGFEHVAASHDRRLAVAVGADGPVGVDVESKAAAAFRCAGLWLNEEERALLDGLNWPEQRACLWAWCAKEAAAKALNVENLAEVFRRVRIVGMDEDGVDLLVDEFSRRAPCLMLQGSAICIVTWKD